MKQNQVYKLSTPKFLYQKCLDMQQTFVHKLKAAAHSQWNSANIVKFQEALLKKSWENAQKHKDAMQTYDLN